MAKRGHRFGMAYFGTRPLYIRPIRSEGVILGSRLVIRDTHQEWDVKALWNLYMKGTTIVQSPQPAPASAAQDPETSSNPDTGPGRGDA